MQREDTWQQDAGAGSVGQEKGKFQGRSSVLAPLPVLLAGILCPCRARRGRKALEWAGAEQSPILPRGSACAAAAALWIFCPVNEHKKAVFSSGQHVRDFFPLRLPWRREPNPLAAHAPACPSGIPWSCQRSWALLDVLGGHNNLMSPGLGQVGPVGMCPPWIWNCCRWKFSRKRLRGSDCRINGMWEHTE